MKVSRTVTADIVNQSQVREDLDHHSWSASKLWNAAKYYSTKEWEKTGEIPSEEELKNELKNHPKYKELHSQSSQRILEEFSESLNSWYNSNDQRDNPPGYRKRWYKDNQGNTVHEEHPRSTVTWKKNGFKHDKNTIKSD